MIFFRLLQLRKAYSPIVSMPFPSSMVSSSVKPSNPYAGISVILSPNLTDFICLIIVNCVLLKPTTGIPSISSGITISVSVLSLILFRVAFPSLISYRIPSFSIVPSSVIAAVSAAEVTTVPAAAGYAPPTSTIAVTAAMILLIFIVYSPFYIISLST